MGSPLKEMTEEERAIFQHVIDDLYREFVRVVVNGREGLSEKQVRQLGDGRIYTAQQALKAGLVDQIGYLEDAFELSKKESGIKKAKLILYKRPGQYRNTIYSLIPEKTPRVNSLVHLDLKDIVQPGVPRFMYLWVP